MTVSIRPLSVTDPQELESLVAAALATFEPGLTVLDRRLVAGAAVVDLVAIDARDRLALWFLALQADGLLLLRAIEAYGWCRENGALLLRLFPALRIDVEAPPRLSLVAPRFPDHFRTAARYLTSLNPACVEYHYLEVNGTPTLYFNPVEGLTEPRPDPLSRGSEPAGTSVRSPLAAAPGGAPPPRRPLPSRRSSFGIWRS